MIEQLTKLNEVFEKNWSTILVELQTYQPDEKDDPLEEEKQKDFDSMLKKRKQEKSDNNPSLRKSPVKPIDNKIDEDDKD